MTVFFKREDLSHQKDADGFLVVNDEKGTFTKFEGVAAAIWESLKQQKTHRMLVEIIRSRYAVDTKTAAKDLDEFLDQALEAGFVKKIEK